MTGGLVKALLDANTLYPAPLRDLLLQLCVADIFRGRWTNEIHEEWINALIRNQPDRNRKKLERTRDLMNLATRDCLVEGYEDLIKTLELPDSNDRHVLAAAITAKCDVIVTHNIKDFPAKTLSEYGLLAQLPDDFLSNQFSLEPGLFCNAVRKVRARLKNPMLSTNQYLNILTKQGLINTVSLLRSYSQQL